MNELENASILLDEFNVTIVEQVFTNPYLKFFSVKNIIFFNYKLRF